MNRSDMRQLLQMQMYLCLQLHGLTTLQLLKRMSLQLHMVEHLLTSAGVILPTSPVPAICVPLEPRAFKQTGELCTYFVHSGYGT